MDLVRLVYHSRRRYDRDRPLADQVFDIVAISVANNQRDDITGGMVHDAKWFVQVLEGPEIGVSQAFERILRDPRHSDVALVNMQPIGMRRFGAWRMAEAGYDLATAPLFRHYCESDRFDPQFMLSDRLIEMVDALLRHAARVEAPRPRASRTASTAA